MTKVKQNSIVNLVDFFSNEVRNYSIYACARAIPSGVDGLKPSQRKVLFGMEKKFNNQEVKVSIASAACMEISAYHHGSLDGVIVNMSQSFPGSNNMPLLTGIGQFGSRIGPEAAATRYIFTKLSPGYKKIFQPVDNSILEYNDDDGTPIEPKFYLPVLPMVLINGAEGMGTGFATSIMAHNPKSVLEAVKARLNGKVPKKLVPWYSGFNGSVTKVDGQVIISGNIEIVNTTTLKITELPIGTFCINYREHLNKMEDKGLIKNYDDNSSEDKTEFIIKATREYIAAATPESLLKDFRLINKSTENIVVWDEKGKIKRFDSVDDLLIWFVDYRLTRFTDRKNAILNALTADLNKFSDEAEFIKLYLANSTKWSKMQMVDIKASLGGKFKYVSLDNLFAIRIASLTADTIKRHLDEIARIGVLITELQAKTERQLYLEALPSL